VDDCRRVLGAKALLAIRSPHEYLTSFSSLRSLVSSAGDFYGGFIGGLVAAALFFRRHPDMPFWRSADVAAPAIALGQAIGRIGCFMAGDDFGRSASVPWSVTFTDPVAASIGGAPLGVPLHPVQLYESVFCFALFGCLVWFGRRRHRDGDMIVAYTLLYAVGRFVLEYFRGDADRGFVFGGLLSTSQFIGIGMLCLQSSFWWFDTAGALAGLPLLRTPRQFPVNREATSSSACVRHLGEMVGSERE
jgi:phosphatidylglycerol:prolipoprotein diacylglycerol transferase